MRMNGSLGSGSRARLIMAIGAAAVVSVATMALPESAAAEKAGDCVNGAWADYNDCLVEARSEFWRKGCDWEFVLDYATCVARENQL